MPIRENAGENFFIRHATKVAIIAITTLMGLSALMLWRESKSHLHAQELVDHTYEVIGHISALARNITEAELSRRGYLVTGNEMFLDAYNANLREGRMNTEEERSWQRTHSIEQEIEILRQLTEDNPSQQENIAELELDVRALLTTQTETIKTRKSAQPDKVALENSFVFSKQRMDRIQATLRVMEGEELHLLALRSELADSAAQQNNELTGIAMGVFYIAITSGVLLYQRSRKRAQEEILLYTRELEKREEELKQQQEELKASNEEIEASNEELEEKTNALEEQNLRIRQQTKELEETKRQIEEKAIELARASEYKSEFLANMSHELRTPLNSLLILSRGLAANEDGNLTPEQIEEARVIHNGGLELLSLINDILDLSKVEAGKISVLPEDTALEHIVRRMREQFGPVAKEKGVAFDVRVDASLPQRLHTDSQRVEQILKNLLSNAFKFTEAGSVALEISRASDRSDLQRASLMEEQAIAFSVIDTGIGIVASKLKDIFEAFQQEDGSTDRHYGGTGLGLTIARRFAHLLGGGIHVASAKGSGSKFTLYLPLKGEGAADPLSSTVHDADAAAVSAQAHAHEDALLRFIPDDRDDIAPEDKLLLIIEDDKDFAQTLMKIARKRGYKCLAAGDGKSGILLANAHAVTAVLLDLRLPDIDGLGVLDQLKHDLKTRHIPVHIITGMHDADRLGPLKKGAIGCLIKPVAAQDLDGAFARIESMLEAGVKKVLAIEDDKSTQTAIHSLLKQKNIEIIMADTAQTALERLRQMDFDCIILDLNLPDMSGFAWLEAAERQLGEGNLPPTVVYTAQELTEKQNNQLNRYTGSIVIKGASSSERLLDEVTLFLHSVESALSADQKAMIRMQHDPDRALQNRTILLVDDDMRNTFALSRLLKKRGLNVIIADNGQLALEKLAEEKSIELVIMDIMMPVMDGYDSMRAIRSRKAWQQLPIIALTARAMPQEQERCMEAGANDYLTKPVDIEQLLTLLRVWLFKQEAA